jgi:hypothetical protein
MIGCLQMRTSWNRAAWMVSVSESAGRLLFPLSQEPPWIWKEWTTFLTTTKAKTERKNLLHHCGRRTLREGRNPTSFPVKQRLPLGNINKRNRNFHQHQYTAQTWIVTRHHRARLKLSNVSFYPERPTVEGSLTDFSCSPTQPS